MPLVRVGLPQSIAAVTARGIGEAIHRVVIEVINVPEADKFQVITRVALDCIKMIMRFVRPVQPLEGVIFFAAEGIYAGDPLRPVGRVSANGLGEPRV
jgi:hypothetical protein